MGRIKISKIKSDKSDIEKVNNILDDTKIYIKKLYSERYISKDAALFLLRNLNRIIGIDTNILFVEINNYEIELRKKMVKKKLKDETENVNIKFIPLSRFTKLTPDGIAHITSFIQIDDDGDFILIDANEIKLKSLSRVICSLGFSVNMPDYCYGCVTIKSDMAIRYGISLVNSPMIFNPSYKKEWMVCVVNLSKDNIALRIGDQICSIKIMKEIKYTVEAINMGTNILDSELNIITYKEKLEKNSSKKKDTKIKPD